MVAFRLENSAPLLSINWGQKILVPISRMTDSFSKMVLVASSRTTHFLTGSFSKRFKTQLPIRNGILAGNKIPKQSRIKKSPRPNVSFTYIRDQMVTNVQNDTTADSLGWISRRKSSFVRLHRWSGFSQNSSSRKVLLKYSLEEICFRIQFRSALKFLMASSFRPLFAKDKTWATEKKKSKLFLV